MHVQEIFWHFVIHHTCTTLILYCIILTPLCIVSQLILLQDLAYPPLDENEIETISEQLFLKG